MLEWPLLYSLSVQDLVLGPENQALEHFHDHGGQSDRSVVVQACYAGLLGNRHYGGGLEALWDVALLSDLLNRAVNTGASWSAHDLRVAEDTLSGPDAFLGFRLRKRLLTTLSCMTNGVPGGPGTASDPR